MSVAGIRRLALFVLATAASGGACAQLEQGGAQAYGICQAVPRLSGAESRADLGIAEYRMDVGGMAQDALRHLAHRVFVGQQAEVLSYRLVKRPLHGTLSRDPRGSPGDLRYRPQRGYVGQDTLMAVVKLRAPSPVTEGASMVYDVSLAYLIHVTRESRMDYVQADQAGASVQKKYCPELMWAVP